MRKRKFVSILLYRVIIKHVFKTIDLLQKYQLRKMNVKIIIIFNSNKLRISVGVYVFIFLIKFFYKKDVANAIQILEE